MTQRQVPVLVVGGSLVGLSTSLLLATAGVPHLLVERHRGTAVHPRAASFHQRTMEIFRSAGIQEEVDTAAEKEFRQNGAIVSVESLAAEDVTFFFRNFNEGVEHLSPTQRRFITQIGLEPVLRRVAEERGARHLYGTELSGSSRTTKASPQSSDRATVTSRRPFARTTWWPPTVRTARCVSSRVSSWPAAAPSPTASPSTSGPTCES